MSLMLEYKSQIDTLLIRKNKFLLIVKVDLCYVFVFWVLKQLFVLNSFSKRLKCKSDCKFSEIVHLGDILELIVSVPLP